MGSRSLLLLSVFALLFSLTSILPASHLLASNEGDYGAVIRPLQIQAKILKEIPDTLIVLYRNGGLVKITGKSAEVFNREVVGRTLTLLEGKLYTGCRPIYEISMEGKVLNRINVETPHCISTTPLPGGRFAVLDNENDMVYILDGAGNVIASTNLTSEHDKHLQNMYGIVVGDKLVISEDGNNRIMSVDLNTYKASVLKDMFGVDRIWGPIAYQDGVYYACSQTRVYRFTESGPVEPAVEGVFDHIVGIGVSGDRLYIARGVGEIYMADLKTGRAELAVTGLGELRDMVVIPAEQPAQTQPTAPATASPQPSTGTVVTMTIIKKRKTMGYLEMGLLILIFILAAAIIAVYFKGRRKTTSIAPAST